MIRSGPSQRPSTPGKTHGRMKEGVSGGRGGGKGEEPDHIGNI